MVGKAEEVVSRDEGELWHRRLGHLHHGTLKILQQISTRLPKGTLAQSDQCKGCTMGKFVKTTFHEKENRASVILERIHTYVCGPFSVSSTTKHMYSIILYLLMNILIDVGSSSCKIRAKNSHSSMGGEGVGEVSEGSTER